MWEHSRGILRGIAATVVAAVLLTLFLQTVWSHRGAAISQDGPMADLTAVLERDSLSRGDYQLLFRETGLSPAAVDDLRSQGREAQILTTQKELYREKHPSCVSLIGGRFTCEDLLLDEGGKRLRSVPLAPLRAGDILVSFSTHTLGWRHGHAGLVVDPEEGAVLEAVQLGSNSHERTTDHWQSYSTLLVLRVKEAARELAQRVAEYARQFLSDVRYSLLPGITCPKGAPLEETPGMHCAYLPWYAWHQAGVDLDENGGAVVTVGDLARSPELEVVQIYGIDPDLVTHRLAA